VWQKKVVLRGSHGLQRYPLRGELEKLGTVDQTIIRGSRKICVQELYREGTTNMKRVDSLEIVLGRGFSRRDREKAGRGVEEKSLPSIEKERGGGPVTESRASLRLRRLPFLSGA